MASVLDLAPLSKTVEIRGVDVRVHVLTLGEIFDILNRHEEVRPIFQSEDLDAEKVARAILASGSAVVNEVLDLALKEEPGTAARAHLTTVDQFRILVATAQVSLPEADVGKARAELEKALSGFGLTLATSSED